MPEISGTDAAASRTLLGPPVFCDVAAVVMSEAVLRVSNHMPGAWQGISSVFFPFSFNLQDVKCQGGPARWKYHSLLKVMVFICIEVLVQDLKS